MRLLGEFWCSSIVPPEYGTDACKEYMEALYLINRNEEALKTAITDE